MKHWRIFSEHTTPTTACAVGSLGLDLGRGYHVGWDYSLFVKALDCTACRAVQDEHWARHDEHLARGYRALFGIPRPPRREFTE